MALHRLVGMEIAVPDPNELAAFYDEIGFTQGGERAWGAPEQPDQIQIVEGPYRTLRRVTVACESEEDLADTGIRLDGMGIKYQNGGGRLSVVDPINEWEFVIEPAEVKDITEQPKRLLNRPGERTRIGARAEVIVEDRPRPPRRLGHVVVGTPKPIETTRFITEGLGFRISDQIGGGLATFTRCSPDHHNLLVAPGHVPYLNHYALEHDDFDAVMRAATVYLRTHGNERQIAGPGRHQIGGNTFWYLRDPAGNFFEYFADMDYIVDDDAWEIGTDWNPTDSWSVWGEKDQPEVFFSPVDTQSIIDGWNKAH